MENASKALIIAGTIIISVFILSIFVVVFRSGSSVSKSYDIKQQKEQLELYNSKFEVYQKSEDDMKKKPTTIFDMISLLNLVYNINEQANWDKSQTIDISIKLEPGCNIEINNSEQNSKRPTARNKVYLNDSEIDVYDLTTKTLKDLGVKNDEDTKLSESEFGDNMEIIYKYTFECINIGYSQSTGQVNEMNFKMIKNTNY